jgi:hypothetical protein
LGFDVFAITFLYIFSASVFPLKKASKNTAANKFMPTMAQNKQKMKHAAVEFS